MFQSTDIFKDLSLHLPRCFIQHTLPTVPSPEPDCCSLFLSGMVSGIRGTHQTLIPHRSQCNQVKIDKHVRLFLRN